MMTLGIKSKNILTTNVFKLYLNNFQTAVHAGFGEPMARDIASKFSASGKWLELTAEARATLNFIDYVDLWSVPQ